MKKIFTAVVILFLLFMGLVYWSVSVGPSEVVISEVVTPQKEYKEGEVIQVVASNRYEANAIKRFMQGVNYRKAWEATVPAGVFLLDSFEIVKEGGGKQTHSLGIRDDEGRLFSLRSINKDPGQLVPEIAKTLGLSNIVRDGISAQHPYGAVLAASLADAVGLLHTHPKIVYVPKHPALGKYEEEYGNRLFLLEYETEGKVDWTSYNDVQEIVETDDLQEMKLRLGDSLKINKQLLVRARLFDLLIGDWDRHAEQWGWVLQEHEGKLVAVPLPGDRDNAFFRIDGVIPSILTNHLVQPMVRPFEEDIDHVPGYVYPVDLYFLKNVPKKVFMEQAEFLQQQLTDKEIEKALQEWPEILVDLNGQEIVEKIKARRKNLKKYAGEFYEGIQERELKKPLKGSKDLNLPAPLEKCFDCN